MKKRFTESYFNELWKKLPWKKLRRELFRLQVRLFKAIRIGDKRKIRSLQKLILRSGAANLMAVRQVTQLNQGRKTAGIDGKKSLNFKERINLYLFLRRNWMKWKHQPLREVKIPKKDGSTRGLKIPTIQDRAWQCLLKYAIEPAHEALFHKRSYGFRPGRSTHDCQKQVFNNLRSFAKGTNKRVISLDIEKCFDKIDHAALMTRVIAPQSVKQGLWGCLKAGTTTPSFPHKAGITTEGTPQGGCISPLLANIALDGIEDIHKSVRYADDMVFILKPEDSEELILSRVSEFLAKRGLNINERKTKVNASTDGFDFLGWHFKVQSNGKFRCVPSEENFRAFQRKVKNLVNNSCYGAKIKAQKLAPIVRGWRNYHKFCKMDGSRFSLWHLNYATFKRFLKEKTMNRYEAERLVKQAFPSIGYCENKFVNVKGNKSPYDGDIAYWSQRNSKFYHSHTAKALKKQNHKCGYCGLNLLGEERVHLHHIDGNHGNWKLKNLLAVHQSCHQYIHMSKTEKV